MKVVVTQLAGPVRDGESAMPAAQRLLRRFEGQLDSCDIVLLPELVGGEAPSRLYEGEIGRLARRLGAWVVGGSHLSPDAGGRVNTGVVAGPSGDIAGRFGKLHPYGGELGRVETSMAGPLALCIGDVSCLIMICADFWHADAFPLDVGGLELILVPAFSVSQRPTPHMARARWRHAAVARAYDLSAFVAISDWAHPVRYGEALSSGVAGLAHPNPMSPAELFQPLGRRRAVAFSLSLAAITDLRENRRQRGFASTRGAERAPEVSTSPWTPEVATRTACAGDPAVGIFKPRP
jgi:hypothetical protein